MVMTDESHVCMSIWATLCVRRCHFHLIFDGLSGNFPQYLFGGLIITWTTPIPSTSFVPPSHLQGRPLPVRVQPPSAGAVQRPGSVLLRPQRGAHPAVQSACGLLLPDDARGLAQRRRQHDPQPAERDGVCSGECGRGFCECGRGFCECGRCFSEPGCGFGECGRVVTSE